MIIYGMFNIFMTLMYVINKNTILKISAGVRSDQNENILKTQTSLYLINLIHFHEYNSIKLCHQIKEYKLIKQEKKSLIDLTEFL